MTSCMALADNDDGGYSAKYFVTAFGGKIGHAFCIHN